MCIIAEAENITQQQFMLFKGLYLILLKQLLLALRKYTTSQMVVQNNIKIDKIS